MAVISYQDLVSQANAGTPQASSGLLSAPSHPSYDYNTLASKAGATSPQNGSGATANNFVMPTMPTMAASPTITPQAAATPSLSDLLAQYGLLNGWSGAEMAGNAGEASTNQNNNAIEIGTPEQGDNDPAGGTLI
jgi:hypothetical protein